PVGSAANAAAAGKARRKERRERAAESRLCIPRSYQIRTPRTGLERKIRLDLLQHRRPRKIRVRIHRTATHANFKMKMRSCHAARRSGIRDHFAAPDFLARNDIEP